MSQQCSKCHGYLIRKNGRYGAFLGCSRFPACRYTTTLHDRTGHNRKPMEEHTCAEPWTNASGIGDVEFCPQSFYLKESGVEPNRRAVYRMQRGRAEHARVSSDRRCYIAGHVFGDDHPVVDNLRLWRDQVLMKTWYGRVFVRVYYSVSPLLIRLFGKFTFFNRLSRALVTKIAELTDTRT